MQVYLCEDKTQLGVCQVLADAVSHTDGPGLVGGVVVVWEERFVDVAFGDEFVAAGEVVGGEVCSDVGDADAGLV